VKAFWLDTEPFLKAVYAFGEVLDGTDPLDAVQVAVVINLWEAVQGHLELLGAFRSSKPDA
jgi:hypothetical protein